MKLLLSFRCLLLFSAGGLNNTSFAADEASVQAAAAGDVDFAMQIQPLLQAHCSDCHGPDLQESRFRVDRRSALLLGGDSGEPAIIPGNSAKSHLIQLVEGTMPGMVMPPAPEDRLTAEQIALLRKWIDQGAAWPDQPDEPNTDVRIRDHWAFQPIRNPVPPVISDDDAAHPIDIFVHARLLTAGLVPNPEASRGQLIRRICLDLLGLPPTPDEVQRFESSSDPQAWEQLVEDCLASSHYGERWAGHWLDLIRFAETNGFETNRERPNAWPFRDYVIRSLNDDKPYDQFLREQIAGDVSGAPVGTGYLVAGPYDLVRSPDINLTLMQRHNELDDMINTTGTAFLGLTLGCARCHNHKFDPIRQTDYYAVQAVFAGVQHGDRVLPLTALQRIELTRIDRGITKLRQQLRPFLKQADTGLRPAVTATLNNEVFEPVIARRIRFSIQATNSSQPCLDELEIYAAGRNVALASAGAVATCSSTLPGYEIHKLEHLNDGRHGNSFSWICNEARGWVQIELPSATLIDSIVWSRDREGKFADRVATDYVIEVSVAESEQQADHWKMIASSADRRPFSAAAAAAVEPTYDFSVVADDRRAAAEAWHTELLELQRQRNQISAMGKVYAGQFSEPPPTHRLFRGDPLAPREQVGPDTVAILGSLGLSPASSEQERRTALAQSITTRQNPLTARVIVNRIWQFHFGRGLVDTPSDFGLAGVPPTHPELLDWLASQLMQHEWSLKHIHRLILRSATYRQSSQPRADAMAIDGRTALWWRFPPRRLEAEPIRDSILVVSGVLDKRMYGPGFSAFEVSMENVRHYFPKRSYGPEDWRRMIYMTRVRQERDSVFGIFDCPDAASSVPVRSRSTTPLQALNLFNSEFMMQQTQLFADRLLRDCGTDPDQQVIRASWLCFSRAPDVDELAEGADFVRVSGLPAFCRAMLNSNEFLFIP